MSLKVSFCFETVLSHPSKIDMIKDARDRGYFVELYFVGTENPKINIERVQYRVRNGGHSVPTEKIVKRYYRSMENVVSACFHANHVTLYDNSGFGAD